VRRGWPPRNMLICHVSLQKNLVALTLGHRDPQIWPPQIQRRNNQRRCNRRAWWSGNPTIRTNPFPWSGLWPKQILPQLLASSCISNSCRLRKFVKIPPKTHPQLFEVFSCIYVITYRDRQTYRQNTWPIRSYNLLHLARGNNGDEYDALLLSKQLSVWMIADDRQLDA